MGLYDNMRAVIGSHLPCEPSFRAVLFGDLAGYFENVKTIKSFSPDEIVLSLKSGGLRVCGKNMYIKKFCAGDVVICGKIRAVEKL